MKREVSYQWRLRQVMAEHHMFTTTELVPLLHERGVTLSPSQVHRLVTGTPERLSLAVLAALCDIFDVDSTALIITSAANVGARKKAVGDVSLDPTALRSLRPARARIVPDQE